MSERDAQSGRQAGGVADTSPLNYLIQIHCEHILPALYIRVFVPAAVVEELDHPRTVPAVREWLAQVPSWLVVRDIASDADPALARLDPGERQVIQTDVGMGPSDDLRIPLAIASVRRRLP